MMITWFNKTRKIKKRYLKKQLWLTYFKLWDYEFRLLQINETREGVRREHDRIRETVDAAKRKWFSEKYTFYYSATGDTVDVMNISLTYEDLGRLPEKPKEPWRFHKVAKPNPDENICKNMEKMTEKLEPDLEELRKRMDMIDSQKNKTWEAEDDGGLITIIERYRTVIDLLKKYIKTI